MQGMFRANGGCGYVKKPEFLIRTLPHEEVFDPKKPPSRKQILKVGVPFSHYAKRKLGCFITSEYFHVEQ